MTNARAASGSRKAKSLVRSPAGNVFLFAVLAVMGAFMALPLVYAVVSAFKPLEEFFVFPPRFYVCLLYTSRRQADRADYDVGHVRLRQSGGHPA